MKNQKIIFFIICLVIISCNSLAQNILKIGVVVEKEICNNNLNQSYSYYIPSFYQSSKQYPIFYGFEPAARGKVPVEKYYQLAEKYGSIFICSNNSKNGPLQIAFDAANEVFDDTYKKLNFDNSRIFLYGFSGGARAASIIACLTKKICGIIACGAGLSSEIKSIDYINFSYVGIVGVHDMNYSEMVDLDLQMDKYDIQHQFIYFKGGHDWPSDTIFEKAIHWLNVFSMKKKIIKTDTASIILLAKYYENSLKDSVNIDLVTLHHIYSSIVNCLKDVISTDYYKSKINEIEKNPKYHFQVEYNKSTYARELLNFYEFDTEITNYLQEKQDIKSNKWWKFKIDSLKNIISGNNIYQKNSSIRILDYLFIKTFQEYRNFLKIYSKAIYFLQICAIIKSEEFWPNYLLAKIYALDNQKSNSIKQLEIAIEKGFNNLDLINKEQAFNILKDKKGFKQLIEKIETKNIKK